MSNVVFCFVCFDIVGVVLVYKTLWTKSNDISEFIAKKNNVQDDSR